MEIDLKTDQMISLVLQINGYAKPDDLHALPAEQRATSLQEYFQAHGTSSPMHWRGDQLWAGAQTPDRSFFADATGSGATASAAESPPSALPPQSPHLSPSAPPWPPPRGQTSTATSHRRQSLWRPPWPSLPLSPIR